MNIGEKSEYYLKAFLLKQKDKELEETIFGKIDQLSDDGNLEELEWTDDAEEDLQEFNIEQLNYTLGASKSGKFSKADISINNITYSVKETSGSNFAIVNHTRRDGFEFACEQCDSSIKTLDEIIKSYWELRLAGTLTQDVPTNQENSPFSPYKEYFEPIINYFLFTGTGSRVSTFPAMRVLEINDYTTLPEGIEIIEREEYFERIWDNLVFSVRSKNMPKGYPDEINQENHASIMRWTREVDGKHKGALHIRVN